MTKARDSGEKLIAGNPSARSNYFIDEVVEAGIVLTGTEVKSLRSQTPNLKDAFVEVHRREAWLVNMHIAPYSHGNIWNHVPERKRKILMQRHQIDQIFGSITQKGLSVIPLRMYFKKGLVKVELGIGRGKKKYDKREDLKKKSAEREISQATKQRQRR